jgi:hypothetical protein
MYTRENDVLKETIKALTERAEQAERDLQDLRAHQKRLDSQALQEQLQVRYPVQGHRHDPGSVAPGSRLDAIEEEENPHVNREDVWKYAQPHNKRRRMDVDPMEQRYVIHALVKLVDPDRFVSRGSTQYPADDLHQNQIASLGDFGPEHPVQQYEVPTNPIRAHVPQVQPYTPASRGRLTIPASHNSSSPRLLLASPHVLSDQTQNQHEDQYQAAPIQRASHSHLKAVNGGSPRLLPRMNLEWVMYMRATAVADTSIQQIQVRCAGFFDCTRSSAP